MATATQPDLLLPLQRLFGHADFRDGQERIVRNALAGRDTLALLPTGSGKSLPYQLAAMLLPTPTLVLSPLIALMKDQVDKLPAAVAVQATLVNSSLDPDDAAERLERFAGGDVKLLYAAPERLRQRRFVDALAAARVGLVVVDEVHCVSMWGHDFRPDYLFIRRAVERLGEPTVLGMTATATPRVESEIARSLGRDFDVVRTSVVRPNLHHEVDRVESEEERRRRLLERLAANDGPSIVYARSRKKCEELSRLLQNHRVSAEHYHAGLEPPERTRVQEAFLRDEARVIVATTAFGMGIDKPDIRLVLLYNYPSSLEDYVQMVGRAGRDGRESACVLFAGDRDASALRRFAREDVPTVAGLRELYRHLRSRAHDGRAQLDPDALQAEQDVRVAIGMLEQAELVRRDFDTGRRVVVEILTPPDDAAERMGLMLARYEREAVERADGIVAYGESRDCRQGLIARHFGEPPQERCGTCDRCSRREIGVVAFADCAAAGEAPADVASAVLAAVERLRWPLGETGLVAMLTGSVAAPPSARRSADFGALSAATPTAVKRTVRALVDSGHLERYESDDGFRLLRRTTLAAPEPKQERAVDEALFERLRAWRRETARGEDVPAFVVFSDRALRAIAAERPRDRDELARVHGVGDAKLERYGDGILAVVAAA